MRDKKGILFVLASLDNVMVILRCSKGKARSVFKELVEFSLIKFGEKDGYNSKRKIYLGIVRKENNVESGEEISIKAGLNNVRIGDKNYTVEVSKNECEDDKNCTFQVSKNENKVGQNLYPNKNIYKHNLINNELQKVNQESYPYFQAFDFSD